MRKLFIFIWCCIFTEALAQTPKPLVYINNTEQFTIESQYVNGETYTIQIGLPEDYNDSKTTYPVLIALDGDKTFGITKGMVDWLLWSKEIKKVITVGITYNKGTDAWWNKRARDYSHCYDTLLAKGWFKEMGGADNFIKFLQLELFPTLRNNYKANLDSAAIMGISFGGMFCSYVLFKNPDLFYRYIIIAPSLVWNDNSILKLENEYSKTHTKLNKNIYIAYGSLDNKKWVNNPTNEIISNIQTHNYENIKFHPQIFEGETHISVFSTALTNGLKKTLGN